MVTSHEEEQVQQLRSALASVQADLTATLPEWSGLQILVVRDEWDDDDVDQDFEKVRAYVADRHGMYWSGGGSLAGSSAPWALISVAEGVQDLLAEVHRVVWPICPTHRWGVHVRPAGKGGTWDPDDLGAWSSESPAWWCRGGSGHDLALVGYLR